MGGKASAWVMLCLVLVASMNEVANGSSDCDEHCFTECQKINHDPYSCAAFCKKNCDQNTPNGRRLLFSHLVDKINKDANLDWIKKIKQ